MIPFLTHKVPLVVNPQVGRAELALICNVSAARFLLTVRPLVFLLSSATSPSPVPKKAPFGNTIRPAPIVGCWDVVKINGVLLVELPLKPPY